MAKDSKNNEVYKIEVEIDNLTKEQYDSIWEQLTVINGHSDKDIEMRGGRAECSHEETAALPLQNVVGSALPELIPLLISYFYPTTPASSSDEMFKKRMQIIEILNDLKAD